MKIRTEVKIGVIVLATLLLVIWGINFLKGKNILNRTDVYYAVYDSAKGLEFAAPVIINGYKVGLINRIYFDGDDLSRIIVTLVVDKKYRIPKGSVAKISSVDILSSNAIDLQLSDSDQIHVYGDTLKSERELDMLSKLQSGIEPLLTDAQSVFIRLDSLLKGLNTVFNDEGIANLQGSLGNLNQVSGNLNNQLSSGGSLYKSFDNLEKFSSSLSDSRESLNKIIDNMESVSDTLKNSGIGTTIERLGMVSEDLHTLLANINSGEGTLGKLAVNDSLYNKLVDVSSNLDLFFQDLRERPKRYVHFSIFGKKDKN